MSRHGKRSDGSAILSVSIPKEIKDELLEIAKRDGRTLSGLIRHKLTQMVAKKGKNIVPGDE
jgi:hypothetical protein